MMTFPEFRATGKDCADIGKAIKDESLEGSIGRLYDDALYIEHWQDDRFGIAPPNGPTWLVTLFNEQHDGDLIDMERRLYAWYLSESIHVASEEMRIATAFAINLREELTGDQWSEMQRRNVTPDPGICASHDFCDANMPMHEAFVEVMGREPDVSDDADAGLWSRAWNIAKREHLTAEV